MRKWDFALLLWVLLVPTIYIGAWQIVAHVYLPYIHQSPQQITNSTTLGGTVAISSQGDTLTAQVTRGGLYGILGLFVPTYDSILGDLTYIHKAFAIVYGIGILVLLLSSVVVHLSPDPSKRRGGNVEWRYR